MGHSKNDFKFLEKPNVSFVCNRCMQSPTPEVSQRTARLKECVENMKIMAEQVLSASHQHEPSPEDKFLKC